VVAAPKIRCDDKGKTAEKKGKKAAGGCNCKVLFSLFGVVKILLFIMIKPPLQLSMSFFNSIPRFSTFRFSPYSCDDKGKSGVMIKEKQQRKKERNQLEGATARSYFPYSVW